MLDVKDNILVNEDSVNIEAVPLARMFDSISDFCLAVCVLKLDGVVSLTDERLVI